MQLYIVERKLRKLVGTLTQRNQVTVPAEVRRHLHLGPSDKLVFVIEDDGEVRVDRAEFDLESAFGSVPPLATPREIAEQLAVAKEEKAQRSFGRQGTS